jgi:hypothetical protein
MPWHARDVGTRTATRATTVVALLLALTGCHGGDGGDDAPGSGKTTDADCAVRIPDAVFDTLRWSPPKPAEATVRGCHRETEQGYVEVDDDKGYDRLCATLDRSGGKRPGQAADWLTGRTACAVEPATGVGTTKVVVQGQGDLATVITVVALTDTDRQVVRAAVAELAG